MQLKQAIIIITLAATALLLFGCTQQSSDTKGNQAQGNLTPSPTDQNSALVIITLSDVSKHNTSSDCWTIVNGKAYDVTVYLPTHPAGSAPISCGGDSTANFSTRMGQGPHPQKATDNLAKMYKGQLVAE